MSIDSGRSDIVPFISSTLKVVPTEMVMVGAADFTITVERQGKVDQSVEAWKLIVNSGLPFAALAQSNLANLNSPPSRP